jgi:hypothetical protein
MMIKSENQLRSINEIYLSDLSEENESTISGGTFLNLGGFLSNLFGGLPSYGSSQPSTGASTGTSVTVSTSVSNINTNNSSSNSNSGSSSTSGGGHGGGSSW